MRIGLTVLATAVAAIALPASAQADPAPFVSPSGNIDCPIDPGGAGCDIRAHTYHRPPPPPCADHFNWGSRFVLEPGKAATVVCHSDSLRVPGEPTLDY